MAAEVFGGLVTIEATPATLHSLLAGINGLPASVIERSTANTICFRTASDNAGTVYIEKANGNKLAWLAASESLSVDLDVRVALGAILLSGTLGDKVYVMAVEY